MNGTVSDALSTVGISASGGGGDVVVTTFQAAEAPGVLAPARPSGPPLCLIHPIAGVLLALGGLKLMFLLLDAAPLLDETDPFLLVSNRTLVRIFGPLELALSAAWLAPRFRPAALWSTLLLATGFLLHYFVAGSINAGYVCPCLGAIFVLLPGLRMLQRFLLLTVILWLLGSCAYVAWLDRRKAGEADRPATLP